MYIIQVNPQDTFPEAAFKPGQRGVDADGKEYVFLEASSDIPAGSACIMRTSGTEAAEMTTANSDAHPVCVAVVAVSDNNFGWFQRYGVAQVETGAVADEAQLYTTSTAGRLDDAASNQNKVYGCHAESAQATAGNLTAVFLNYPFTDA